MTRKIRRLGHGEVPPVGIKPCRFTNDTGYVVLRWKIGVRNYVEVSEHRLIAGLPPPDVHVHHRNGDKTDNRPENLELLTLPQHSKRHRPVIDIDIKRAKSLYASGLSFAAVAEAMGLRISKVQRALVVDGVTPRPCTKHRDSCMKGHPYTPENTYVFQRKDIPQPGRRCRTCYREYRATTRRVAI